MNIKSGHTKMLLVLLIVLQLCPGQGKAAINKKPWSDFPELPVELMGRNQVITGQNIGPPLRPFKSDPVAYKLVTTSDTETMVGSALNLRVDTFENRDNIKSCVWSSPEGVAYLVDKNRVTVNGTIVKDIIGNLTDPKSCHLSIRSLKKSQLGTWACKVELLETSFYMESFFTATTAIRVSDVRLPVHLKPEKYAVYLTPFIVDGNFTIQGFVKISINVIEPNSNNITLHLKDMKVYENSISVKSNGDELKIVGFGYDDPRQFLIIRVSEILIPGRNLEVSIGFLGNLNDDLSGFYRSSYFDAATNRTEFIATTQFEATDARRALPCFDEPAMKAKFQINLGRTRDMSSISNMPIFHEGVPMSDNDVYVWDQFAESVNMSTYLLAFVISRFTYRQSEPRPNGVQFRIWSRSSAFEQTAYAADVGPKVLEFFEQYYNIKFPLPKQDMIAIPDFSAGAMENWGLITYREVALLYEPGMSSLSDREYVATVIAHELAHQWFGDLVTMEWWDGLWLNEGFASYMEYLGASHVEPDTGLQDRFALESIHNTFKQDSLQSSHPISVPVNHPDEINEIFDSISYGKGASVIRMMANFLGLETFNGGITNYLNKHEYANAKQDDLWQALTDMSHQTGALDPSQTVKEVMDTWTLQMGYPVVKIERSYDEQPERVSISQDRFLLTKDDSIIDDHVYRWWIPISYSSPGGDFRQTKNTIWLSPQDSRSFKTFDNLNANEPVIVNVQQTGFYRVNYDPKNWEMIGHSLKENHKLIHRINRAQILDDSLTLARAGHLDYKIALSMTEYLIKEEEYIPWYAAITSFQYIELMLGRSGGFGDFKRYVINEVMPVYTRLGFVNKKNDSFMDISLRELVVNTVCELDYEPCVQESTSLFKSWMNGEEVNIGSNLRKTVYCTAIAAGSEKEWDFLWQQYLVSNNANEKSNILKALACSQEIWILQRYLDMSIDPNSGVRKQDGSGVISNVASNRVGRYLAWGWLQSKWSTISTYFDTAISSSVGKMITACARDFNNDLELRELSAFYDDHLSELGTAKRDFEIAIQNAKANIQWMQNYYNEITQWLKLAQSKTLTTSLTSLQVSIPLTEQRR